MPYIEDDFLQEVLSRNDIVEVIGGHVHLTKKGNNFWGLCPFHGEKTPSFSVKQDQQFFYCFGCHTGGNVVQFIQKQERLEFVDAVRHLADRVRLPMPENKNDKDYSKQRERKEKMYNAARDAAKFYNNFLHEEAGSVGLKYFSDRGLPPTVIKRFGLGMSPSGWTTLNEHMNTLGYDNQLLHEIGLLGKKDERYFDSLRNRVIFPIIDHRSRVVGFAGRVLDDSMPKYINSPETPIYNKSHVLYGAHYLKRLNSISHVMLVEGYMDVISLHKAGYLTAVASSGTALTSGQARLLKRYCDYVYICFDGDSAGQKATWKAQDILHAEGLKVKVISLPDKMDPDDFASQFGMAGINEQIESALTMNDYKISIIEKDYDFSNEEQRKDYVIRVCTEVLSYIEAPVEVSMYVKRIHLKTGFEEVVLNQEIDRAKKQHQKSDARQKTIVRQKRTNETTSRVVQSSRNKTAKDHGAKGAARLLFTLSMNHKDCAEYIVENIKKEDFEEGVHQQIADLILTRYAQEKSIDAPNILGLLDEVAVSELATALELPYELDERMMIVTDCVSRLKSIQVQRQIDNITKLLKDPMLEKSKRIEYMNILSKINHR
ncbi:MAG: DNA primase [Clostridiales bacterium]|nr:DNA primase [Clostridiales bacterium]